MEKPLARELAIKRRKIERKTFRTGMIFILPSLILFSIFVIYPFGKTLVQSLFLSDNKGFLTMFVGFKNYLALFRNPNYIESLWKTLAYTLLTVPFSVLIALLLSVLSNSKLRFMGIYKTIFSATMGISVAAGAVFWNFVFHPTVGLINSVVKAFGGNPVGWLTTPSHALISVAIVTIWMNIGFTYLVLMGGLKNIDPAYYESVDIVGGGFWYRLRKVTIPLLSPSLFFVVIISIINAFQSFGVVDMLTQGGPMNSTRLLVYGIYQEAFVNYQYGSATAQGVILFAIIFAVSMVQIKLTERWVTYQ